MDELIFDYAIKFQDGTYYTGRVNSDAEPDAWKGTRNQAFTYSEQGAHNKIARTSNFALCTVERVLYSI